MRPIRVHNSRRPAFTLLELLVVVAIIAILLALTAAGVFQVIQTQRESNTKTTMMSVNKMLAQQMKIVADRADKDPTVPANVVTYLAGGDPKRARIIWKKLKLKQEFPMTFAEATQPWLGFGGVNVGLQQTDLPAKNSYAKALGPLAPVNSVNMPFFESSTCLLLALQEKRDGVALDVDQLGASAIDLNGDGLKELVDGWNHPIAFFRFPCGNAVLDAANPAGPPTPGVRAANFRDTYDPDGLLLNPVWNTPYAATFQSICHAVNPPNSNYMVPVLVSPGRDGKWGLNSPFSVPALTGNPDMSVNTANYTVGNLTFGPADGNDNVYSFLLQLQQ